MQQYKKQEESDPLLPGKRLPVSNEQEVGWASEPVWTQRIEEKLSLPPPRMERQSPGRPVRSQTLY
jgi:hypothetical protein